jgi:hypothetical protein
VDKEMKVLFQMKKSVVRIFYTYMAGLQVCSTGSLGQPHLSSTLVLHLWIQLEIIKKE